MKTRRFKNRWEFKLLFFTTALLAGMTWSTTFGYAQGYGDRDERREYYRRDRDDDDRGRDSDRRRGFSLESLDTNGDGLLQQAELPERMRDRFGEMGERAGVKPGEPIPLDALRRGYDRRRDNDDEDNHENRSSSSAQNSASSTTQSPSSSETKTAESSPSTTASSASNPAELTPPVAEDGKTKEAAPLVPGFGVEVKLAAVPGFGVKAPREEASSPDNKDSAKNSDSGGRSSESMERVKRYALSLMRQYDKNKNEVLDPDEWKEMRGDPAKADSNQDGFITLRELTDRLADYGRRRRSDDDRGSSGGSSGGSSEERDSGGSSSASESTKTVEKQLPEGLPSWFAERDKNGDGQVMMAEYASSWNEQLAAEFVRYDLNNDGVVTPQECLNSLQPAAAGTSASTSTSAAASSNSGATSGSSSGYGSRGSSYSRGSFGGERRSFGSRN